MRAIALRHAAAFLAAIFALLPQLSSADSWPAKPIRLVVPFPAGGGTDIVARDVSHKMTATAKWTFVIDNKPGSGGNIGIDAVAKSPADGYTLVIGQTSNLAINASLYSKLPYDPVNDLTPIGLIGDAPLAIVTAATSPYRSLAEVLAAAKKDPGSINYATSGNGTVAHLATELLQRESGVKLTHVPYKGTANGLTDVLSGQVHLYVSSVPSMLGYVKTGKLRALAVTALKRTNELPQVPTVAELGYKGFEAVTWFGLLGPARLPADVVKAINGEMNKALAAPDLRKKLVDQGLNVSAGTADEFGKLIRADLVKWGRVVKESGAKVD